MPRRAILALLSLLVAALPAWALYDPKPDETPAAIEGEWKGSLTYRDYSDPDRIVTLSTEFFVTLGSPQELVMHYIYDDGPGKVVHSYETMRFDFEGGRKVARHTYEFRADRFGMRKDEIDATATGTFRDRYEFTRPAP